MKKISCRQQSLLPLLVAALIISAATATAADFAINPSGPNNGLTKIYSATFDAPLTPSSPPAAPPGACPTAPDPAACQFFRGEPPPPPGAITVDPNPSNVEVLADTALCVQAFNPFVPAPPIVPPCTTLFPSATPSALDLTLSVGNTQLAINGGNIYFPNLAIVINAGQADETNVPALGASIVNLTPSVGTVPIDANGIAIFEIDIAPATAADFSTFTEIVTSCTGPLCALIPILTLDMQRYRLIIDWDPTFSFFTADFTGQTANNSMVFATFNSVVPDITVTDSVAPTADLLVPFGSVTELASANQTVTVSNDGSGDLNLGQVAQSDMLAAPFSILTDMCSGQTLAPAASCVMTIQFSPVSTGAFNDSFDIPSNDPDENPVTVTLTGTGTAVPVPSISVADSVAPIDDLQIPFGDVTETMFANQTLTITNNGNADLIVGQIAQTNALAAPFSIPLPTDNCSGQTLIPTASCVTLIRFAPTAAGIFTDSFDIPSNDPDDNPVTIDVSGTGIATAAPDITVTDSIPPVDDLTIPFGNVTENTAWNQTVTITNDGSADLTIGTIAQLDTLAAPFSILNDNCSGQTIAPATSCIVDIQFLPAVVDVFNDSFDIPSNDPDEPALTFNVNGTGVVVGTGVISLKPSGASSGFFGSAISPATLLALFVFIAIGLRRRFYRLLR